MIDFIKIHVIDKFIIDKFYNDNRLNFLNRNESTLYFDSEIIQTKEKYQYKGILFCFSKSGLEILFKPHYYKNNNEHNANDFSVLDCIYVITEFIEMFDITEPQKFKIVNLEFGLNAISPINIKDLISRTEYHNRNQFVNDDGLKFSKKSFKPNKYGRTNHYKTIKFYAKGLQYPEFADEHLFRFEVKSKKSMYINTLGIYDISDLLNKHTYKTLYNTLLDEFNDVLILYAKQTDNLNTREKNTLNKYLNTYTWYEKLQKHRNEFVNTKNRYNNLLNKTGYNIHDEVHRIIKDKLDKLINFEPENKNETCAILPPTEKNETCAYLPIVYCKTAHFIDSGFCPITKLKLDESNNGFKYAKTPTLKKIKENEPLLFNILKNDLLKNADTENRPIRAKNEILHMAKQIRNRYYRQTIKNKTSNSFFDSGVFGGFGVNNLTNLTNWTNWTC